MWVSADVQVKEIVVNGNNSSGFGAPVYFDSNASGFSVGTWTNQPGTNSRPSRIMNDGTDVWNLHGNASNDGDVYVAKSTDNGATFATRILSQTATVLDSDVNLSRDGNIYTRGNSVVIPYVVIDNVTMYYNEYIVRSLRQR